MFNVGGGELLVIMLIALIVLGPTKLPEVARQVGSVAKELRRMSTGFQAEMKAALEDPTEAAARERGNKIVSSEVAAAPDPADNTDNGDDSASSADSESPDPAVQTTPDDVVTEPEVSTAEAAGMYDVAATTKSDPPAAEDTANDQATEAEDDTSGQPAEPTP